MVQRQGQQIAGVIDVTARQIEATGQLVVVVHFQAQAAYATAPGGLPVTDAASARVISLPMHPYLTEADQDVVIGAIRAFAGR